jgi:hypothetical protein
MNDVEVIKQSASALLGIFGGFALITLLGVFYYFVSPHFSLEIMLLFLSILSTIFTAIFWYIVYSQSEKLFLKM